MKKIALFGIRSPLTADYEETCDRAAIVIEFAVSVAGAPRLLSAVPIIELADLQPYHLSTAYVACAFGPLRRRALVEIATKAGFAAVEALIDPTSTIARSSRLGAGTYVNAGCVIGALSMIGSHVVVNRSCSVGHHTVVADYVSLGPGATLTGNVRVEEGCVIGAGSTILPGIRIGEGSVVAAGSVVRRNVPDGVLVAGNPAEEHAFNVSESSLNFPDAE